MPIDTTTTNLENVDFSQRLDKAALKGQNLAYHRMKGVNLSGLDLTKTNFTGSELTDALFTDAVLDQANFTDAIVTLEQIQAAKSSEGVILPTSDKGDAPPDKAAYEELQAQLKEMQAKLAAQEKALEAAREVQRLTPSEQQKRGAK